MTELEHFQELKQKVLLKYQEYYPFFQGTWKNFSSKDIQNLISFIEEKCKKHISEKWIYTHLKPDVVTKIPRKDMLDILCEFVSIPGWDAFVFENKASALPLKKPAIGRKPVNWLLFLLFISLAAIGYYLFQINSSQVSQTIKLNDEFTDKGVKSDEVKVFQIRDSVKKPLDVKNGKIEVHGLSKQRTRIEITSPFYKRKVIEISSVDQQDSLISKIDLKPDDYAMMLKAFMVSDIKDWQTRKIQLDKILADDLEVLVMLKDDLGAEYFNKKDFSQKLIVPTNTLKKMRIVEIERKDEGKIKFIRIKQE